MSSFFFETQKKLHSFFLKKKMTSLDDHGVFAMPYVMQIVLDYVWQAQHEDWIEDAIETKSFFLGVQLLLWSRTINHRLFFSVWKTCDESLIAASNHLRFKDRCEEDLICLMPVLRALSAQHYHLIPKLLDKVKPGVEIVRYLVYRTIASKPHWSNWLPILLPKLQLEDLERAFRMMIREENTPWLMLWTLVGFQSHSFLFDSQTCALVNTYDRIPRDMLLLFLERGLDQTEKLILRNLFFSQNWMWTRESHPLDLIGVLKQHHILTDEDNDKIYKQVVIQNGPVALAEVFWHKHIDVSNLTGALAFVNQLFYYFDKFSQESNFRTAMQRFALKIVIRHHRQNMTTWIKTCCAKEYWGLLEYIWNKEANQAIVHKVLGNYVPSENVIKFFLKKSQRMISELAWRWAKMGYGQCYLKTWNFLIKNKLVSFSEIGDISRASPCHWEPVYNCWFRDSQNEPLLEALLESAVLHHNDKVLQQFHLHDEQSRRQFARRHFLNFCSMNIASELQLLHPQDNLDFEFGYKTVFSHRSWNAFLVLWNLKPFDRDWFQAQNFDIQRCFLSPAVFACLWQNNILNLEYISSLDDCTVIKALLRAIHFDVDTHNVTPAIADKIMNC